MSRPHLAPSQAKLRRVAPKRARHCQIVVTPATRRALDELVERLDAASQAEAVRAAIHLAVRIVRESARGSRLTVTRVDASSYEVLVPVPEERS